MTFLWFMTDKLYAKRIAVTQPESILPNYAQGVKKKYVSTAFWSHALPFAAWLVLMTMPGLSPEWNYALRTVVCALLVMWLRPNRGYVRPRICHLPPAFLVGVAVFVIWIFPESHLVERWPLLREIYLRWAILPLGKMPLLPTYFPFAPEMCGWPLALIRLLGSTMVIAPIEEFFWRGLVYRWLIGKEFTQVDLGTLRWPLLLAVSICFGLEHDRWLVGLMAGLAYGLLMIRTRDIWAAVTAHAVTNFLLGLYVLAFGAYQFW